MYTHSQLTLLLGVFRQYEHDLESLELIRVQLLNSEPLSTDNPTTNPHMIVEMGITAKEVSRDMGQSAIN